MSRYQLLSDVPGTKVFVGWDTPLQTFQVEVLGCPTAPDGEPTVILRIGNSPGQCESVAELADHIGPWATLPPGIAANLERERETTSVPIRSQAKLLTPIQPSRIPR